MMTTRPTADSCQAPLTCVRSTTAGVMESYLSLVSTSVERTMVLDQNFKIYVC
jgi:hypothetical protein